MKMYYCTRFLHNPNRPTEYYVGIANPDWKSKNQGSIKLKLFESEALVELMLQNIPETDWHEVEIVE